MKPTLLFYGNCQAAALSVIFSADPTIAEAYNVLHIPSFDDRIPDSVAVNDEAIAATTVFFDQHDKAPFPKGDILPADCRRVTFPSVDLFLLWPLHCVNVYNDAPTPQTLWGRFPYGDRAVVDGVMQGLSAGEVLASYETASQRALPDLDRFEKLEYARLRARDAQCEVKMSDFVVGAFRTQNLFWCVNHPSMFALRELTHRLIAAAGEQATELQRAAIDATIATLHPEGPLSDMHAPIHPAVVDHFKLEWYPRDDGPYFGLRDNRLTYQQYLREMIECSVRVRDEAALGLPTSSATQ